MCGLSFTLFLDSLNIEVLSSNWIIFCDMHVLVHGVSLSTVPVPKKNKCDKYLKLFLTWHIYPSIPYTSNFLIGGNDLHCSSNWLGTSGEWV